MFNCGHGSIGRLLILQLWWAGGCSLAVDSGREQCSTDRDCETLDPALDGSVCVASLCQSQTASDWACLDDGPPIFSVVPEQVRVVVPFVDVVSNQPTPGIEIQVCERIDANCLMPVASEVSDQNWEVDLRLRGGFNGYLRWQAADVYPTLFFFGGPLVQDAIIPVRTISPPVFEGLDDQLLEPAIARRSTIFVFVKNCSEAPGSGVSLSIAEGDDSTRAYYLVDGLYVPSQTETSVAGVGRLVNVPRGSVSITGTLADGREMGTVTALAREDFATLVNLGPAR